MLPIVKNLLSNVLEKCVKLFVTHAALGDLPTKRRKRLVSSDGRRGVFQHGRRVLVERLAMGRCLLAE